MPESETQSTSSSNGVSVWKRHWAKALLGRRSGRESPEPSIEAPSPEPESNTAHRQQGNATSSLIEQPDQPNSTLSSRPSTPTPADPSNASVRSSSLSRRVTYSAKRSMNKSNTLFLANAMAAHIHGNELSDRLLECQSGSGLASTHSSPSDSNVATPVSGRSTPNNTRLVRSKSTGDLQQYLHAVAELQQRLIAVKRETDQFVSKLMQQLLEKSEDARKIRKHANFMIDAKVWYIRIVWSHQTWQEVSQRQGLAHSNEELLTQKNPGLFLSTPNLNTNADNASIQDSMVSLPASLQGSMNSLQESKERLSSNGGRRATVTNIFHEASQWLSASQLNAPQDALTALSHLVHLMHSWLTLQADDAQYHVDVCKRLLTLVQSMHEVWKPEWPHADIAEKLYVLLSSHMAPLVNRFKLSPSTLVATRAAQQERLASERLDRALYPQFWSASVLTMDTDNNNGLELCRICEEVIPFSIFESHTVWCGSAARTDESFQQFKQRLRSIIIEWQLQERLYGLEALEEAHKSFLDFMTLLEDEFPSCPVRSLSELQQLQWHIELILELLVHAADQEQSTKEMLTKAVNDLKQMHALLSQFSQEPIPFLSWRSRAALTDWIQTYRLADSTLRRSMQQWHEETPVLNETFSMTVEQIPSQPSSRRGTEQRRLTSATPRQLPSLKDFNLVKMISRGAQGRVFLARKKTTGDYFALKCVRKTERALQNRLEHLILSKVHHPFVVTMYYAFESETHVMMVMAYQNGGDLYSLLRHLGTLTEPWTRQYMAEAIQALSYIHSLGYVHRDMKPDNLLIGADGHLKLSDFGLSTAGLVDFACQFNEQNQSDTESRVLGTPDYLAPECILSAQHGPAVDFWAVGCIAFECLTGLPPFHDSTPQAIFARILSYKSTAAPLLFESHISISDAAQSFISALLEPISTFRLGSQGGADKVKEHVWFQGLDWMTLHLQPPPFIPQPGNVEDTDYFATRIVQDPENETDAVLSVTPSSNAFVYKNVSLLESVNRLRIQDLTQRRPTSAGSASNTSFRSHHALIIAPNFVIRRALTTLLSHFQLHVHAQVLDAALLLLDDTLPVLESIVVDVTAPLSGLNVIEWIQLLRTSRHAAVPCLLVSGYEPPSEQVNPFIEPWRKLGDLDKTLQSSIHKEFS